MRTTLPALLIIGLIVAIWISVLQPSEDESDLAPREDREASGETPDPPPAVSDLRTGPAGDSASSAVAAAPPDGAPNEQVSVPPLPAPAEETAKAKAKRVLHELTTPGLREDAANAFPNLVAEIRRSVIAELRERMRARTGRYESAFALWRVTGETEEPIKVLLDGFVREPRHSGVNPWQYLCLLLSRMGPDAAEAVPGLIDLYERGDGKPSESDWIFYVFAKIGPAAKKALPIIREAVDHEHPKIRTNAAYALHGVAGEVEKPVRVLIAALEGGQLDARGWAAAYVGEIGPRAKGALPALEKVMSAKEWPDSMLHLRVPAAASHWRISGRTDLALPLLIEGLADDHAAHQATAALIEMGPKAKSALPALRRAVRRTTKSQLRREMESAIESIEKG